MVANPRPPRARYGLKPHRADGWPMLRGWRQLARRARVAAILTDIIRHEIMVAAANKARFEIQLDARRPFGSSTFAPPVLLYGMADDLRADRALSVPSLPPVGSSCAGAPEL